MGYPSYEETYWDECLVMAQLTVAVTGNLEDELWPVSFREWIPSLYTVQSFNSGL